MQLLKKSSRLVVDKRVVKERFEAGFQQYNRLALVQQQICNELAAMIARCLSSDIVSALEVGVGTGFLTTTLIKNYSSAYWYLNDIADGALKYVGPTANHIRHNYMWGDAELLDFPSGLNLIATASTVQWFDDLPAFVCKCANATAPKGMLALSTFGTDNFCEIKAITDQGLEYYTKDKLIDILTEHGYRLLESSEYIKHLTFDTPIQVLHHIKATGVNSIRKSQWTKGTLSRFEASYREKFSQGQGVRLTYHPIILVAEKI